MAGLFDLMDCMVADELGVDVEVYIKIIERDCTHWESTFIILAMLEEGNETRKEKGRKIFNQYVNKEDKGS
jgi:hypothetical protein